VELITPHRTINYHETRKGGQGPVWAVAPLIIIIIIIIIINLLLIRNVYRTLARKPALERQRIKWEDNTRVPAGNKAHLRKIIHTHESNIIRKSITLKSSNGDALHSVLLFLWIITIPSLGSAISPFHRIQQNRHFHLKKGVETASKT
jgi:hypothetical protein